MYAGPFSSHNNTKRLTRLKKNTIIDTNLKPSSAQATFSRATKWHQVEVSSCLSCRAMGVSIIPYF